MRFGLFKRNTKGQIGSNVMTLIMSIILIVAVAIPVSQQVISSANLTGVTATVVNLIPLLLGVAGLAIVMLTIKT